MTGCHECRCHISPPCNACIECEACNPCRTCDEQHDAPRGDACPTVRWSVRKLPEGYWQVRSPREPGGYLHYAFASGADALSTFAGGWPQ